MKKLKCTQDNPLDSFSDHALLKSQFLPDMTNRDARFLMFLTENTKIFDRNHQKLRGAREMDFF